MAGLRLSAQAPPQEPAKKPDYDKKEEIIYDDKRYRIHNNYLTVGSGALAATNRQNVMRAYSADYHFHYRRQYFQTGLLISGESISAANDLELHACYGFREEKTWSNVTIFGGPSLFTGVEGTPGVTAASLYQGLGAYFDFQAVFKFKYDLGLGFEVFADLSGKRDMGGLKIILFFSSAYQGKKGNYNPHVRSENGR